MTKATPPAPKELPTREQESTIAASFIDLPFAFTGCCYYPSFLPYWIDFIIGGNLKYNQNKVWQIMGSGEYGALREKE